MSEVIDETSELTVLVVGNPFATILDIRISCKQPDGTWKSFSVIVRGETPQAVAGTGTLSFGGIEAGVIVRNDGDGKGLLFCRVKDQSGKIIFERQSETEVEVGDTYMFPGLSETILFDMPTHDYVIIVEAGHIE